MKQKLSFLLALLMLAGTCVSCASDNPETENESESAAPAAEEIALEETEAEKPFLDNLPEDLSFGGADFTWLLIDYQEPDYFTEELTGEGVNDAIYERTVALEDRFDVKFLDVLLSSDNSGLWNTAIQGSVSASDGAYDVVCPYYWWGLETKGYYCDLRSLPYLDFSQPYWCEGWNDNCVIYGKQYTVFGDFTLDIVEVNEALYFNKTVLESGGLEDPYDLVKEGTWTSDKMIEMAGSALLDLNGDGKYNPNDDCYGLMYNLWSGRGVLCAMGMTLTYKTEDGGWSVDYFNDHFLAIVEKMYRIHNETPCVHYGQDYDMAALFAADQLLFMGNNLETARGSVLRDMESDFGVVPFPKFDESQEEYISYNSGRDHGAILKSAKNLDMSAAVLEAFSAENHKTVLPALYDDALKEKYSRDPKTAEMLDLIQSTIVVDFAFVNDEALGKLCNLYFDSIVAGQNNFASIAKSKEKLLKKQLQKLMQFFEEAE